MHSLPLSSCLLLVLTTITNPTPGVFDIFGSSVAAVGDDKLAIAAQNDDTGATNAGAAYLFDTNGVWLTTFTNPSPANGDAFGYAIAGVGNDRVLIGVPNDDAGAQNAGVAYLFNTAGTLLMTFTNPTPALNEQFGWAVAGLGSDRVLIGAVRDNLAGQEGRRSSVRIQH